MLANATRSCRKPALPRRAATEREDMYDTAELMRDTLPNPSNPYLRVANTAGTRNEIQTPAERRYEGLKPLEPEHPQIQVIEDLEPEAGIRSFIAEAAAAKMRLDAYLAKALPHISRGRVQLLIENGQVTVNGSPAKSQPQAARRRADRHRRRAAARSPSRRSPRISRSTSSTRTTTSPSSTRPQA